MTISRRSLAVGVAAAAFPGRSDGSAMRAPDLSRERVVRYVAGIRPFRRGGVRIDRQRIGNTTVVHNYGHGGAGYTLSWGSAVVAARLAGQHLARGTPVAVLGAGVIGLSTAAVLLERGFRVSVYAHAFPPHTTSDVAGAEWSPDFVDRGTTVEEQRRFDQMLVASWRRFQRLIGPQWGVSRSPIYEADDVASGLDSLPRGILPPPREIASLPFAPASRARVFTTLLIEPPRYLPALVHSIERAGGVLRARRFERIDEVEQLPERIVVNCLGLGAQTVVGDAEVIPMRGQLVHLRPEPLPYLLDHPNGYVIPRADALVLGGTFEVGVSDPRPDPVACERIIDANRAFFAGKRH